MTYDFINIYLYPFIVIVILLSVLGYGNILNFIIVSNSYYKALNNLIIFQGLIIIGFLSIILNIVFPINDYISILIIIIGLFLYLLNFFKINKKKSEIIFILFVFILSTIFSLYAGINDDFDYHLKTINNFKNHNLFEIAHGRRISYNSHWLFLHSVFSLNFLTSSLFVLGSIIYSTAIYDTYFLYKKSYREEKFILSVVSFFILIFYLGIINKYKDFGTDVPGVIISFYVLLIIVHEVFHSKNISKHILTYLALLTSFAVIIKITNILLFILLPLLILNSNLVKISIKYIYLPLMLISIWFFQNIFISGCLIWPIESTCFINTEDPKNEIDMIQSFSKGDINAFTQTENFQWINQWIQNHSKKIIETYGIFFLIAFSPIIIGIFKKIKLSFIKELFSKTYYKYNFLLLFFIIFTCNLIWFLYAPAYRFGLFYNSIFIIFSSLPFWLILLEENKKFVKKYFKVLLLLLFIYFIYENIYKINWYFERYEIWPPIFNGELIERI